MFVAAAGTVALPPRMPDQSLRFGKREKHDPNFHGLEPIAPQAVAQVFFF